MLNKPLASTPPCIAVIQKPNWRFGRGTLCRYCRDPCFLAALDDPSVDTRPGRWFDIFRSVSAFKLGPAMYFPVTKPTALRAAVNKVRESGWAVSKDEFAAGVIGCAVPIRTPDGRLVAGLGISVPSARLAFKELERLGTSR
jgi:hypothetical protein